jgi:hypothetical protein
MAETKGNWNEHVYAVIGESNLGTDGPGRCTSFRASDITLNATRNNYPLVLVLGNSKVSKQYLLVSR